MARKFKYELPNIELQDNRSVGERISEIRKSRGLTQEKLAGIIGIARVTLADYERGRSRIYDEMIVRIAIALSVSTDQILGCKKQEEIKEIVSLRYTKRIKEIEEMPEHYKRTILKTLDDLIKANKK
ncbi:MAG: helix-turn-helix domain-containing protein [Spirochaetaceae bacterium]